MQIKLFTIPVTGGEALNEDLNLFLRTKKILQTEGKLVNQGDAALWCFCIKYLEDAAGTQKERVRIDYMQVLDADCFRRFSKMREIRKRLSTEEAIPAYAIFTDEELAGMARFETLTASAIRTVKGIGEKKAEKYGVHFLTPAI
jgi:superfamily II DNA helicase RecQ